MKHWISVTCLSLVLCFLFGAWWGHRLQEKTKTRPEIKVTVSIAAEKNAISEELSKELFEKYQVKLVVKDYETPADLLNIAKSTHPPDLVLFPSYMFRGLQHRDLLGPLDSSNIPNTKNISKDLRFAAWDPEENFAVPLSWNGLFFVYNPKRFKPPTETLSDLLKTKKIRISLKRDLENVIWLSQIMGWAPPGSESNETENWLNKLSQLPWASDGDVEKYLKGDLDLLQLSWSDIQRLKIELGEYQIWYPSERSPFFLNFIALNKNSVNPSKAQKVIHQILDEEIYPSLLAPENSAAVMDVDNQFKSKSASYFRQLPLTRIRPLINAGFDLGDLEKAHTRLFESSSEPSKPPGKSP